MNAIVTQDQPRLPALQSGGAVRAIVPQDFDGAWRIATAVVKAGMAPPGLESPEKAMVAIMHGLEVGLTPMAALQSIAVINGRPTIWGDGALALVRSSGLLEWIEETTDATTAICRAKRRGEPNIIDRRFSDADATAAGLIGKAGPWKQYKARMRQMRARSWVLRDGFADVLKGLGIAEEVQDIATQVPVTPMTRPAPPKPPVPPTQQIAGPAETFDAETGEITVDPVAEGIDGDTADVIDDGMVDDTTFFERLEEALAVVSDLATVEEVWTDFDPLARFEGKVNGEINQSIALAIRKVAEKRIGSAK